MMLLSFRDVEQWTHGESLHCDVNRSVAKLIIDSRQAQPGVLFAALPGMRTDGHQFVRQVWQQGGVALVQKGFPDSSGPQIRVDSPLEAIGQMLRRYLDTHQVKVVGVTGSVGKTSIKELSAAVLRQQFEATASLGNYNTAIGLPLSFFSGSAQATHFVAEMGMRGLGEIRHLTQIAPPDVAVISTISPSHLEVMGTIEAIQAAKGEILEGLKPGGTAVLNLDNPWVRELGEKSGARVLWFGKGEGAHARVIGAQVRDNFTEIAIHMNNQEFHMRLPWLGAHQAHNVAAALLVGQALGIAPEAAVIGIQNVDAGRSRIHVIDLGDITVLEDVYNASPVSAIAALDVLASRPGRRVAVLGDMLELGDDEVLGHREVGEHVPGRADMLLAVGSRSRYLYEAAHAQGVPSRWVSSREEAAEWLKAEVRPGDAILLKASRGLEFEWLTARLREMRASS